MTKKIRDSFYSVAAQSDNLGDIVIRQVALDYIAPASRHVVVYVGRMPAGYIQAFDFPDNAKIVRSRSRFALLLVNRAFTRRANLIFAPGPLLLKGGLRPGMKSAMNAANVLMVRIGGGRAIALGRALRGTGMPARVIEQFAIRRYDLFVTRDTVSSAYGGTALRSAPDLAFARAGSATDRARRTVAISLRGDRPMPIAFVERVLEWAHTSQMEPVFVTQVHRDEMNHEALARRFGARHVSWGTRDHRAQLARVEATYASAAAVISDRLHGLILGIVNGAAPIAIDHPDSDKLRSTLEGVVSVEFVDPSDATAPPPTSLNGHDREAEAEAASSTLVALAQDVHRLLTT